MIQTERGRLLFATLFVATVVVLLASTGLLLRRVGYGGFLSNHFVWGGLIALLIGGSTVAYSYHAYYASQWTRYDSLQFSIKGCLLGLAAGPVAGIALPVSILLLIIVPIAVAGVGIFLANVSLWLLGLAVLIVLGIAIFNLSETWDLIKGWFAFGIGISILTSGILWLGGALEDDSDPSSQILGAVLGTIGSFLTGEPCPWHLWRSAFLSCVFLGAATGTVFGICGGLIGALRPGTSTQRAHPGYSVHRTLVNSILLSFIGLAGSFSVVSGCHLIFQKTGSASNNYLLIYACIGSLLFALFNGPLVIKHFVLRAVLAFEDTFPFRLVRTLDQAVDRILLRRVTSGFFFIHKQELDYFVSLNRSAVNDLSEQV